ncbi:MAG: rRNA maturation RNase YbeY [Actinomycetota bacterium]|nr:rRNA maturation RNase YbeY [Actinomycetota bacterium]
MGEPPVNADTRDGSAGVEVFVADEQVDVDLDLGRFRSMAQSVLEAEGVRGEVELALVFVDEPSMTELNVTHMGGDGPTDVLAFPIDDHHVRSGRSPDHASRRPPRREPMNDPGPLLLGDVAVCPAVAARNAPENSGSYAGHQGGVVDELDLLVVHGILHVLGMDHAEDDERAEMQTAERQHLAAFRGSR